MASVNLVAPTARRPPTTRLRVRAQETLQLLQEVQRPRAARIAMLAQPASTASRQEAARRVAAVIGQSACKLLWKQLVKVLIETSALALPQVLHVTAPSAPVQL